MSAGEIALIVTRILGGLALFIYGMQVMTAGLEALAGSRMRELLNRLTHNRLAGFTAGTGVGLLVQSSAGTVMLVGFVNAGLLSLAASIPIMLGTNLGTTLSMQVVSFKLSKYAFAAIALGLGVKVVAKKESLANLGMMLFGFGLLFLGMKTMSAAIVPLREAGIFEPFLAHTDASTAIGLILGILASAAVTGIIQSSGAMIGMLFALAQAGVFSDLSGAFPLVLGAQIGTCVTALLGSLGTNIDGRRTAISHLAFNFVGAILAALMAPIYLKLVPALGGDLTRQIANTHTAVQLFNALLVLPFTPAFARLIVRLTPSKAPPEQPSFLDERHLKTPEAAIVAVILESRRMSEMVRKMLRRTMKGLFTQSEAPFAKVMSAEESVDLIKESIHDYLLRISRRRLSKRQAFILQYLMRGAADIERIGDHAESLINATREKVGRDIWFDDDAMALLRDLYQQADTVLGLMAASLNVDQERFDECAAATLEARERYLTLSKACHTHSDRRLADKLDDASTCMTYMTYVTTLDRIVRHSGNVARAQEHKAFRVKKKRLGREAEPVERPAHPSSGLRVDSAIFRTDFGSLHALGLGDDDEDEPAPSLESAPPAKQEQGGEQE